MQDLPPPDSRSDPFSDPGGYFKNFACQVKEIFLHTESFFRSLSFQSPWREPCLFLATTTVVQGLALAIVERQVVPVLLAMPVGFASCFLVALIMHGLAKLLGGKAIYKATFICIAYASAANLLSWMPLVGKLIGLFSIYLNIVGLSQAHQISRARAAAVVLIPITVAIVLGLASALIMSRPSPAGAPAMPFSL